MSAQTPVDPSADERNLAMLAHLSGFAGLLVPFGNIVAPLVIWRLERAKSAFVAEQSLESLNFNISVMLAGLACTVLVLVGIGVFLGALLAVGWIVSSILGALRAAEGRHFRHRFTLRLVQ
jgi:uncharacterized Tic20 family protein